MKVKELLYGDYRKQEVRDLIQKALRKIPALARYDEDEEIPLEVLEKVLWKLKDKYGATMQYIMPVSQIEGEPHYSCSFKSKKHEWIGTVNGLSIYEVYAKGVLMCYRYAKESTKDIQ